MKIRYWAALGVVVATFVVVAAVLNGCKGFWDLPSSTGGGGGTTPTTLSSGVFYVLNQKTDQIVTYSITSGALSTPVALTVPAAGPIALAVAPNGKFLYVSTLGGIYLYTIASNGALTVGNTGEALSSDPATTMQVDATDSWLVDAISGSSHSGHCHQSKLGGSCCRRRDRGTVFRRFAGHNAHAIGHLSQ